MIEVFQLCVTLCWVKPRVVRVIIVPSTWTLSELHAGLCRCMSWCHLKMKEEFCSIDNSYDRIGIGDDADENSSYHEYRLIMSGIRLTEVFSGATKKVLWRYDYDDDWEHVVEMEKKLMFREDMVPCCIDGANASPPEDIGGPDEYRKFCRAMSKSTHARHESEVRKFGRVFDPDVFDPTLIFF